jgi:hypothetical protein
MGTGFFRGNGLLSGFGSRSPLSYGGTGTRRPGTPPVLGHGGAGTGRCGCGRYRPIWCVRR